MTGPTLLTGPYDGRIQVWQWTLAANETGTAVVVPQKAEKTVHVFGTFGGAVSIEGSLEMDVATAANFAVLWDSKQEALSGIVSTVIRSIQQNPYLLRPVAGAGVTAVTVRVLTVAWN